MKHIIFICLAFLLGIGTVDGQQRSSQPPLDGHIVAQFKNHAWWLTEYKKLNDLIDRLGGTISTSYRVGPKGTSIVKIQLIRGPSRGLTVKIDLPPEAIVTINPKTGKKQQGSKRTIWTYRDHDLDGMPDDVLATNMGKSLAKETYDKDGYMRIRDSADHTVFFVQWTIGLSFSTNHFLHGRDSINP